MSQAVKTTEQNLPQQQSQVKVEDTSVADKVLQLTIELAETVDNKKSSVKAYNEEIKRIKAEIAELIADDKETAPVE